MLKKFIFIPLILCFYATALLSAEKVAYVDLDYLFNNSNLGKKIIGSKGGNIKPHIDIKKIYSKFKKNRISFSKFYEKTYKIDQVNLAINKMKSGKLLGRPLIKFE